MHLKILLFGSELAHAKIILTGDKLSFLSSLKHVWCRRLIILILTGINLRETQGRQAANRPTAAKHSNPEPAGKESTPLKRRMSTKQVTPLDIKQVGNTKFMLVVLCEKITVNPFRVVFNEFPIKTAGIAVMIIKETLHRPWVGRVQSHL